MNAEHSTGEQARRKRSASYQQCGVIVVYIGPEESYNVSIFQTLLLRTFLI
jgi:hypothetical protein